MKGKAWRVAVPVLIAVLLAILPVPDGLTPNAWYYFAIFAAVVAGLILEPIPAAAIGVMGVTLAASLMLVAPPPSKPAKPADKPPAVVSDNAAKAAVTPKDDAAKASPAAKAAVTPKDNAGKAPASDAPAGKPAAAPPPKGLTPADSLKWALSGFSDGTVWLIFVAYMFAMGYEKTGLGRRLGLGLVKKLGKRTLGLGYAVALSDLVLSPFIPSNTARSGGTIYPIIENIPRLYGSSPDKDPRKIGSYLMWTAIATTSVTSSLFLTGLAPNLLALSLVQKGAKISISWTEWCTGFLPVGVILFLTVPYLTYKLYPPTIKVSHDVHRWAGEELEKLGRITTKEILMAGAAILALLLWIFGGDYLNATTVALVVLSLMIATGIVTWDDVIGNKQAWNVLVWFGTLVTLAEGLNRVGFLKWISEAVARSVAGVPVLTMLILLVVFFFMIHYIFASITAHVTGLLPVMLLVGMAVPGMPVKMFAMLLCYTLGIMGILTPYATGPSPIYYGSGYISRRAYWSLGLFFGVYFLAVLLLVGVPYLRFMSP
jgi:L-tartrate/succinate antiporter